jgi:hypothetical protein
MLDKIFEFISIGIMTPIIYFFYAIATILFIFILGFPIAVGIRLISIALDVFFKGVL